MKSSNPVLGKAFNQSSNMQVDQLEQNYNAPAASSMRTGRMTLEDVVAKTGFLFAILVVVGAVAWSANLGMGYRDWETDRKSTRLNSSHRL